MEGHRIILNDFLVHIKGENITSILDAGSGRTSLSVIANSFSGTPIDAVVYPGDIRKINSVKEIAEHNENISVIEKDICGDTVIKAYDLIVAHLLLGEAAKFGNSFEDLLEKVITMKYKYLIIIDYLEDPAVNENDIMKMCEKYDLTVVRKSLVTNQEPQVWENFTGVHNFGYLIKRL
ncbi:MAG: hypothetical protein K2H90_09180 [Oscillospiraceae bacterium]|nr:hypothetical protein [Oscillospiraceae bacterium]